MYPIALKLGLNTATIVALGLSMLNKELLTKAYRHSGSPFASTSNAEVIYESPLSAAFLLDGKFVDVVLSEESPRLSLGGERGKAVSAAIALKGTEDDILKTFGEYAIGAQYVVGPGIDGLPAVHRVKPYCRGKTLDKLSFSTILDNPNSLFDFITILEKSREHRDKYGIIPDLQGYLDVPVILKRFYAVFPIKSSNIIREQSTGRLLLIDAEGYSAFREAKGVKVVYRWLWHKVRNWGNYAFIKGLKLYFRLRYPNESLVWSSALSDRIRS